jgi:RNase H-like domain found in reverse transcriptase
VKRLLLRDLSGQITKCEFLQDPVEFLGHKLSKDTISITEENINKITHWETPQTTKTLQKTLGFFNYIRKFIYNYSDKINPLIQLLNQNIKSNKRKLTGWTQVHNNTLHEIKNSIPKRKTLATPKFNRQFCFYSDASNIAIGGILLQPKDDNLITPNYKNAKEILDRLEIVRFHSHLPTQTEKNYSTIEKELFALVRTLDINRHLLLSCEKPLICLTNHKNLETFHKFTLMRLRHLKWSETIAQYRYTKEYVEGAQNIIADFLSRPEEKKTKAPYVGTPLFINSISDDNSLILDVHCSPDYIHPGIKTTKRILKQLGISKSTNEIKEKIRTCIVC